MIDSQTQLQRVNVLMFLLQRWREWVSNEGDWNQINMNLFGQFGYVSSNTHGKSQLVGQ